MPGGSRHRAYMMIRGNDTISGLKAAGVYTGFGNEWIKVGGLKYAADGSASERTMRMSTPYVGTNDYGILTMTQKEIDEAVEDGHRHNFQVGIHANGDVTIDMVLGAYERTLQKWPDPNRRHRIEHCTLVNPDLLKRIKACGCIPTPFWTYVYYHGEKWEHYGQDRMRSMFAHRSFLDNGIPRAGRLRLRSRSVRAVDGDSEHGDATRLPGARLGREPESHRRRGAEDCHDQRRLRLV